MTTTVGADMGDSTIVFATANLVLGFTLKAAYFSIGMEECYSTKLATWSMVQITLCSERWRFDPALLSYGVFQFEFLNLIIRRTA